MTPPLSLSLLEGLFLALALTAAALGGLLILEVLREWSALGRSADDEK